MNQKKSPVRSKPDTEKRSRKEIAAKAVLCTLICLWMFILGFLMGRGTAPVRFDIRKLQDELATLKAAAIEKTTRRYQAAFQELDRDMNLGFHEALKDEETDISKTLVPTPEPSQSTSPEKATEEESIPVKTKATDIRKNKDQDTTMPWVIQVAATQDKAHGTQLVKRLENIGIHANLIKASIPGRGTWYRIRASGYSSREEAEADISKLKNEGFSPIIVSP